MAGVGDRAQLRPTSPLHVDPRWVVSPQQRAAAANVGGNVSLDKLGYQWSEEGLAIEVRLQLEEAVAIDSCDFAASSCTLRLGAVGSRRTYFFDLRRTYAELVPEACSARLIRAGTRVRLKLQKLREESWPSLRR